MKSFVIKLILATFLLVALPPALALATSALDPVQIRGKSLSAMMGRPAQKFRLFALHGQTLEPIAFQIDQRDAQNRYQLTQNLGPLGAADEILWMAADMGGQAPDATLERFAQSLNARHLIEITMNDDGENRAVYLLEGDQPAPIVPSAPYVTYDAAKDLTITPYYYSGYADVITADRFGWINNDGSFGPNVLNRVSVRFKSRAFLGLIPFEVTEDNLKSRILGYKQGRIRLIKRVESNPQFPLGFKGPSNITEGVFYRNFMQTNVRIQMPPGANVLLSKASFKIYLDAAEQKHTILLTLPGDRTFAMDPGMTIGEHIAQADSPTWIHISNPDIAHSFAVVIDIPEKEREFFHPTRLVYNHKMAENSKGPRTLGTLDFEVLIKPHSGEHLFNLYIFAPTPSSHENTMAAAKKEMQEIFHALKMMADNTAQKNPSLTLRSINLPTTEASTRP